VFSTLEGFKNGAGALLFRSPSLSVISYSKDVAMIRNCFILYMFTLFLVFRDETVSTGNLRFNSSGLILLWTVEAD
jgi:hypothetical protein